MLEANLPIPEVIVNNTLPILLNTFVNGEKALNKVVTAFFPKLRTENTPLNVFLILPAVESLILNFSVRFLNPSEIWTNFSPVIGGNTSLKPSLIAPSPLPTPCTMFVTPFITSSLPPFSFQNLSIAFLASVDG